VTTPTWGSLDRLSSSHRNPYADWTDDELVEALAHVAQTGRIPRLPKSVDGIDLGRLTDAELLRRFHRLDQARKAAEPPPLHPCPDCGCRTPHSRDREECQLCFSVGARERSVEHWLAHLKCDLDPIARDRVAGLLAEARRKLARSLAAESESWKRGSQEEPGLRPGPDRDKGVLGHLKDLN
jgi:hypothetical protein